jgi:hypothetical protein
VGEAWPPSSFCLFSSAAAEPQNVAIAALVSPSHVTNTVIPTVPNTIAPAVAKKKGPREPAAQPLSFRV